MPDISIIVPVYNAEKYVSRCIDSILKQSFFNFELILVDDGSNDNSGIICDKYAGKDKRICVIHKENGGVSSARNFGIDKAIGKYISFCDADDYLENDFLQHAYAISEKYDVGLYKLPFYIVKDGERKKIQSSFATAKFYENSGVFSEDDYIQLLDNGYLSNCWGGLIKKDVLNDIRFDNKSTFGEDTKFIFDILERGVSFYADNVYLYNYAINQGSIIGGISIKKCESIRNHYLYFFDYANHFPENGNKWYSFVEKRCSDDIYGSIKKIVYSNSSIIKKRRMLNILFSEKVLVNSCIKFYKNDTDFSDAISVSSILIKYEKRKLKHLLRRIKRKAIKK